MKLIILMIASLMCATAMADFALRSEVINGDVKRVYTKKPKKGDYIKIPSGYNSKYHVIKDEMIDDMSKPQWATRSMVEACADEADCKAKALTKECVDGRSSFYNAEYSELWCNKIDGYAKKKSGQKIVAEDVVKKETYQNTATTKKTDEMYMEMAGKAIDCGKRVISRMLLQNKPKNLKKAQIRNLVKTYKDIKDLLDTGSLESAREDILAVAINEPIVTQADKDALILELDTCKL